MVFLQSREKKKRLPKFCGSELLDVSDVCRTTVVSMKCVGADCGFSHGENLAYSQRSNVFFKEAPHIF